MEILALHGTVFIGLAVVFGLYMCWGIGANDVANAIGAAIAQVGGQIEKVFSLEDVGRDEALASIRAEAIDRAVAAGAMPGTVEVVELDEIPLTYLPGNATLIRAKAVGDLRISPRG